MLVQTVYCGGELDLAIYSPALNILMKPLLKSQCQCQCGEDYRDLHSILHECMHVYCIFNNKINFHYINSVDILKLSETDTKIFLNYEIWKC